MGRRKIVSDEVVLKVVGQYPTLKAAAAALGISYWTVLDRLKRRGISTRTKRYLDPDKFASYTRGSCYWAGFLAADGTVHKSMYQVAVELARKDKGHLEKLRDFLNSNADIGQRERKDMQYVSITFNSKQLAEILRDTFNIVPRKSLILMPPENMPQKFISHFIRGYFDGDGSVGWHNKRPRVIFASGSEPFLEWLYGVLRQNIETLGNPAINRRKESNTRILEFSGRQTREIYRWLYDGSSSSTRLGRKYADFARYVKRMS